MIRRDGANAQYAILKQKPYNFTRLRGSSFETFVWSTEVKEVPPHSHCSTTVNWLTDTYW